MPEPNVFHSDADLFYDVGVFGDRGYGVPNFGKNQTGQTLNADIERFTTEGGRRISVIMHQPDALRVNPPSNNVVTAMVGFINRARTVLVGRSVAENEDRFQGRKVQSARIPFRVFPCPRFKVDNRLMQDFCAAAFACLAELFQATENVYPRDISTDIAELALRYVARFQRDMALDYFGLSPEEASAPDLDLSTQLERYTPLAHGFISAEQYDDLEWISFPDETDLGPLAKGILIGDLPPLSPYPYMDIGGASPAGAGASAGQPGAHAAVPAFPEPSYNL